MALSWNFSDIPTHLGEKSTIKYELGSSGISLEFHNVPIQLGKEVLDF